MNQDKKVKIFLVDDDAVFSTFLKIEFLQHTDFAIETYPTGEGCIAHLSQNPDVIILDYHLDGADKNAMTGIQTLDKIKSTRSDIAVVMLSAQDELEVAINCLSHQAIDYVAKDKTTFIRLKSTISTILGTQKWKKP